MVKPAFEDLAIDFWVHPGRLGPTQPSICLFHDVLYAGTELLDALTELKSSPSPVQRTLTFRPCSRKRALHKLTLRVVGERDDLKVMSIRRDAESATIEMTDSGLALVSDAVASWLAGAEDFGVSPHHSSRKTKNFGTLDRESAELWFWGPRYYGP